MIEKTNRGGEGRNARSRADRSGPALPKHEVDRAHGIARTPRGEDHPEDKSRAQKVHKSASELPESEGEKAQREAAEQQAPWPGEPAGHE